jgi:hypothetical protein
MKEEGRRKKEEVSTCGSRQGTMPVQIKMSNL